MSGSVREVCIKLGSHLKTGVYRKLCKKHRVRSKTGHFSVLLSNCVSSISQFLLDRMHTQHPLGQFTFAKQTLLLLVFNRLLQQSHILSCYCCSTSIKRHVRRTTDYHIVFGFLDKISCLLLVHTRKLAVESTTGSHLA